MHQTWSERERGNGEQSSRGVGRVGTMAAVNSRDKNRLEKRSSRRAWCTFGRHFLSSASARCAVAHVRLRWRRRRRLVAVGENFLFSSLAWQLGRRKGLFDFGAKNVFHVIVCNCCNHWHCVQMCHPWLRQSKAIWLKFNSARYLWLVRYFSAGIIASAELPTRPSFRRMSELLLALRLSVRSTSGLIWFDLIRLTRIVQ